MIIVLSSGIILILGVFDDSIEDGKWYTLDIAFQSMIPLTNDAIVAKLRYEKENKEKS